MKVAHTLGLLLALCLAFLFAFPAAALDPKRRASGQDVAVCTLSEKTDLKAISNASRGIVFKACPDAPHGGAKLASVTIEVSSGLQSQLWDIPGGKFDSYWLKQYLTPLVPGFPVDCWESPDRGCAKPAPAPPAAAPMAAVPPQPRHAASPSDAQLVPLMRRLVGAQGGTL